MNRGKLVKCCSTVYMVCISIYQSKVIVLDFIRVTRQPDFRVCLKYPDLFFFSA